MADTSVSISDSRKEIAGEFLRLSAEQYHDTLDRAVLADDRLVRAVDLAYNYGLTTGEIEAIIGVDSATFEPLDEVVPNVV